MKPHLLLAAIAALLATTACNTGSVVCVAPKASCGVNTCVNLQADPLHCGACGTACATGQSCVDGACACPANTTSCGGACIALELDSKNCGACGVTCRADQACSAGKCGCPQGTGVCGDRCAATGADARNCGGCGKNCAGTQLCQAGSCVTTCTDPALKSVCGTGCVDLTKDPLNCGKCGESCASDRSCLASACVCNGGKTSCGTACADLQSDAANCGGCGKACAQGQSCLAGKCGAAVLALCFNTGELVGLDDALQAQPTSLTVGQGPQSIARSGSTALVGDGIDNALYSFDSAVAPMTRTAGGDALGKSFNQVLVKGTRAYAINSGDSDVQVIDLLKAVPSPLAATRTVDQILTKAGSPASELNTNPYFGAFLGDSLYVTLLGTCTGAGDAAGNRLLELDTSVIPGKVSRELHFNAADYDKDAGVTANSPRPAGLAVVGKKIYVAIGNLNPSCFGSAGPGYVAVVDSVTMTVTRNVKLPAECRNPGFIATAGTRVYVSCAGSYGFGAGIEEALSVIDSTTDAVVKTTTFPRCGPADPFDGPNACKTAVPGRLAIRGTRVYVADNNAGRIFTTDLDGKIVPGTEKGKTICPLKCDAQGMNCYQFTSDVSAAP